VATAWQILDTTQSLCPTCLQVIDAWVVIQDEAVYLKKKCPDHGLFTTYIWPDADHYRWMNTFQRPFSRPRTVLPETLGCPRDCGPCISHLRHATLVEIEVTQRCNLRCPVCFMDAGAPSDDPSLVTLNTMLKSITRLTGTQVSLQITGGEPTIRKDMPEIVRMGRQAGFAAIEINTNGVVIGHDPEYLYELARAGISGIYLQFDGLSDSVYEQIRGENLLQDKLKAIENCRAAGVQVVLAMTVIGGINEDQVGKVLDFALENQDIIAGVAYQPAFTSGRFEAPLEKRITMGDVIFMLAEQSHGLIQPYELWPLGCSHPLCSSATYIVEQAGSKIPLTRLITPGEYAQSFDPHSPQGSVFPDIAARLLPECNPGLSVVVMNYMDAMSMDLKRLKECSMYVARDERLVPFCACQVSGLSGSRLYPTCSRFSILPRGLHGQ
jgi:7,8-dihydro-6-hydroxymethylpterin dimethyltransferase